MGTIESEVGYWPGSKDDMNTERTEQPVGHAYVEHVLQGHIEVGEVAGVVIAIAGGADPNASAFAGFAAGLVLTLNPDLTEGGLQELLEALGLERVPDGD